MKHAVAVVSLLASLSASPLFSYVAGTGNGFVIEVNVTGPKEINTFSSPWTNAAYQGEGIANIDITAVYYPQDGEPFNGYVPFSVADGDGELTFTYDHGYAYTTASATVDLSSFNATYLQFDLSGVAYRETVGSFPAGSFYSTIFFYKNRVMSLPSGDDLGRLWTTGRSPITLHLMEIKLTPASNFYAVTSELKPVVGETISPDSPSFITDPSSASTDDSGAATFSFFPLNNSPSAIVSVPSTDLLAGSPLRPRSASFFSSPCTGTPLPSDSVTFQAGSGQVAPRTVIVPYARIAEAYGDVRVKGSLGGEWQTAQSGCNLGYGDIIFLGPMDVQSYQVPSVSIEFFNRGMGVVDGTFTKEGSNLLIKLGDHVEVQEYTVLTDVRNLAYDVYANPREWAKSAVIEGIGKGVEWGLGAYGWVASKVGGTAVTYGIKKLDDWSSAPPLRSGPPQPIATQTSSHALDKSVATAPLLDSRQPEAMGPAEQYGAEVFTSFRADGTADIVNRAEARVLSDGTTSVVIPPWSTVTVDFKNATAPTAAVPMLISPFLEKPALTITPADLASVTTSQPKLTFSYGGSVPVMPTTFVARLNGYLVSPTMIVGSTTTTWYPPKERPFVRGQNLVSASIMTISGATSRKFSRITAAYPLPTPEAPRAYPGRAKIVLQWDRIRDAAVAGAKVFRSETAEGTPTEISTGVLTQTAFVDNAPLAGTGYYRIAGVTGTGELTPYSPATAAALSSRASQQAPPAVAGLTAVAGDGRVTLTFSDPSRRAIAFRVERQAGGSGGFTNVLPNDGIVSGSPFVDAATNWTSVIYRVTPLGLDLLSGAPSDSASITPQDGAPAAPAGVTADVVFDGVHVEWNPSSEPDLAGYHVERGQPGGAFVRVTTSLLTAASYWEAPPPAGLYGYRIIAVDGTGHESAPSPVAAGYIRPPASIGTPSNVVATAVSGTQVEVSWSMVFGASNYSVERKAPGGNFELIAYPVNHWFTDTTASPGTSYLYRVQASGEGGVSAFSAPDLATTVVFEDSPLIAGTTVIKAAHVSQLRTAIAAVRALANLGGAAFTDSPSTGALIRTFHVTEMRAALDEALGALSLATGGYADSSLGGVPVKAAHLQQLRNRLQ